MGGKTGVCTQGFLAVHCNCQNRAAIPKNIRCKLCFCFLHEWQPAVWIFATVVLFGLKYFPWLCCHEAITAGDRFVHTNGIGRYIDDKDSLIAKFKYGETVNKPISYAFSGAFAVSFGGCFQFAGEIVHHISPT